MKSSVLWKTLLGFLLITGNSFAAEIRLKPDCNCPDTVVVLGDVADVVADDSAMVAALAAIELFPTPARLRTVSSREIENILALHSVDFNQCLLTGSTTVHVRPTSTRTVNIPTYTAPRQPVPKQSKERIASAIVKYLRESVEATTEWQVAVDEASLGEFAVGPECKLSVTGGCQPWTGRQEFELTATSPRQNERTLVAAEIGVPELAVYAVRPLRRGEIVQASHVELQPVPSFASNADLVYRIDEVVGKEATRTIAANQLLDRGYIRPPVLVRRGEVVTVYALAAGVRVRSHATAQGDGSRGELVTVQTLDKKHKYTARVAEFQVVEVYAAGPQVLPARKE